MSGKEEFIAKVKFCPNCSEPLQVPKSLIVEYWVAAEIVSFCWCSGCAWRGEIKDIVRVTAMEPEE